MTGRHTTLLTTSHVARRLGVSDQTVRLWAKQGKLDCAQTAGGIRLFQVEDVERLARQHQRDKQSAQ
jgi:excisionase family DNA binding protein